VKATLATQTPQDFRQPDNGLHRAVYDVGVIDWEAGQKSDITIKTRLLITARTPGDAEAIKPRIGARRGEHILELFVTDRPGEGFSAVDLVGLYLARGGFEGTLAAEDRESDPDRFVSQHPAGQAFWQLLCQWVWNLRLRLGAMADDDPLRRTLWAPAVVPTPLSPPGSESLRPPAAAIVPATSAPGARPTQEDKTASPVVAPAAETTVPRVEAAPAAAPGVVAAACGRGHGRYGGADFQWQSDGTLRCPAGKTLRCIRLRAGSKPRPMRYAARRRDCAVCGQRAQCLGRAPRLRQGRRVTVHPLTAGTPPPAVHPVPPPVEVPAPALPALGPDPMWWLDLPGSALRGGLRRRLYGQTVQVEAAGQGLSVVEAPTWETRTTRAHRRLDWAARHARNRLPSTSLWRVHLTGVPPPLQALLAFQASPAH